jgi:AcrR family transcriptional regulator
MASPSNSREAIIDAALRLIGRGGIRAATVRAVENEAGVAHGNVRHWFGSKAELIHAAVGRLAELDMASAQEAGTEWDPAMDVPANVSRVIRFQLRDNRENLMARFEIFLESGRQPALAPLLTEWGEKFWSLSVPMLEAMGSPDPEGDARSFVAMIDGLMLDQIARPDPDFDPARAVRVILAGIAAAED